MSTLKELVAQKEVIESKITEILKAEKKEAINKVKALIVEFGLSKGDIYTSEKKMRKSKGTPAAVKYRDPATGETWSGRGRTPKWIDGKNRDNFLI